MSQIQNHLRRELIDYEEHNDSHLRWIVFGFVVAISLLFLLVWLLLRGICTETWYIKLFGLQTTCKTNVAVANLPNAGKTTQKLEINGKELTLSDGGGTVTLNLEGSEGPAGPVGAIGSRGLSGATGSTGATGPAGIGGGTLDDAYNFGGLAAGRVINATGTNQPVAIRTPIGAGLNSGLEITGDGGVGNPTASGMSFNRVNLGGPSASSAIVYSDNIANPFSGVFGFNAFDGTPGDENFNFGLIGVGFSSYGVYNISVAGSNIGTGDSFTPAGNGLDFGLGTGNGGVVSGNGGNVNINSGNAPTDGNGGQISFQTGIGSGPTGVGGNFNMFANNGDQHGGSMNFNTGVGGTGDGGSIGFGMGSGANNGGGFFVTTGSGGNDGGNINFNSGNGVSNGGFISFNAGNATNNNGGGVSFNTGNSVNGYGGGFGINGGSGPLGGGGFNFNGGNEFTNTNGGGGFNINGGSGAFGGNFSFNGGTGTLNGGNFYVNGGTGTGPLANGGGISGYAGSGDFGGSVNFSGGTGAVNGGALNLNGGNGSIPGVSNGGGVNISAGSAFQGGSTNISAGNGDFSGADNGGSVNLNAGNAGNAAGNINLYAGTATTGPAGGIYGQAGGGVFGGTVQFYSGNASGGFGGNGGDIFIATGNGDGAGQGGSLNLTAGTGGTNGSVIFNTNGGERGRFDAVGNFGIGTTTPTNKLDVTDTSDDTPASFTGLSGTCTVDTNAGALSCPSDQRLKTNILSISNGLEALLQLQGVTYNWKVNPDGTQVAGFIAQDVQKVLPNLVTTLPDGTLTLNKEGIMPYIVEAVKQQNGNIDAVNQQLKDSGLQLASISDELKALSATVKQNTTNIKQNSDDISELKKQNKLLEERLNKLENQAVTP